MSPERSLTVIRTLGASATEIVKGLAITPPVKKHLEASLASRAAVVND
jgi:UDP-N-acetylmuramyl pentapeptide synthase